MAKKTGKSKYKVAPEDGEEGYFIKLYDDDYFLGSSHLLHRTYGGAVRDGRRLAEEHAGGFPARLVAYVYYQVQGCHPEEVTKLRIYVIPSRRLVSPEYLLLDNWKELPEDFKYETEVKEIR